MERKVFVTPKIDFTDEKTGLEFKKDNPLQGLFICDVVRFPAGTLRVDEIIIPLDKFSERLDLLYLTDEQILEKLVPAKN
ncbi:MAG: hypothetical protein ABR936_11935 [Bacteroidota bacterium]